MSDSSLYFAMSIVDKMEIPSSDSLETCETRETMEDNDWLLRLSSSSCMTQLSSSQIALADKLGGSGQEDSSLVPNVVHSTTNRAVWLEQEIDVERGTW